LENDIFVEVPSLEIKLKVIATLFCLILSGSALSITEMFS